MYQVSVLLDPLYFGVRDADRFDDVNERVRVRPGAFYLAPAHGGQQKQREVAFEVEARVRHSITVSLCLGSSSGSRLHDRRWASFRNPAIDCKAGTRQPDRS